MRQLSLGTRAATILHTVKRTMFDKKKNESFTLFKTTCLIPSISDESIVAWPAVEYKVGSTQEFEVIVAPKSNEELKVKLAPAAPPTTAKSKA